MDLQKFSHACVRIQSGGRALAIDPGNFSSVADALAGVEAVLVTHEHADHLDLDPVVEALKTRTGLSLHAPATGGGAGPGGGRRGRRARGAGAHPRGGRGGVLQRCRHGGLGPRR